MGQCTCPPNGVSSWCPQHGENSPQRHNGKGQRVLSLTEHVDGSWTINEYAGSSRWPPVHKPNTREMVARVMQLVGIGPVAPQISPEDVCIGSVTAEPSSEGASDAK